MTSNSKEFKIHRATADKLLKGLTERIAEHNDNPYKPYFVERAVVFGSYVNDPGREMLSDLDIGLKLGYRYEGDFSDRVMYSDYQDILTRCPSYAGMGEEPMYIWELTFQETLRFLRNRSHYISVHLIGQDEAIFSGVTKEIEVGTINRTIDDTTAFGDLS